MIDQKAPWFDADIDAGFAFNLEDPLSSVMVLLIDYRAGYGDKTEFHVLTAIPVTLVDAMIWNLFTEYGHLLG